MDLDERIARRLRTRRRSGLVARWPPLNPAVHLDEPVGRGPTLERFLDELSPLFSGDLPHDKYVYGPPGSGKSAVVCALVDALDDHLARPAGAIQTTTRASTEPRFAFAYVDARRNATPFRLYRSVLDAVSTESVPERGVSVDDLRDRLHASLGAAQGAVVAVDHVGEPGTPTLETVSEVFEPDDDVVSWVAVGRTPPESLAAAPDGAVHVQSYRQATLIDLVTTRTSRALQHGIEHRQARELASWADGDAHDALAAVFGAASVAVDAGHEEVTDGDLARGKSAVPRDGVPIARVLALPENRQIVLDRLLALDEGDRRTIEEVADAIAGGCDLSAGTIQRFLYELAEEGVLARVPVSGDERRAGREPSRVEPRFPTLVFERLRR